MFFLKKFWRSGQKKEEGKRNFFDKLEKREREIISTTTHNREEEEEKRGREREREVIQKNQL